MTFISQLALLWLLAFGFGYTVQVARRPFRPTWLMVVVGVGGTLAGISAILWDLSRDWLMADEEYEPVLEWSSDLWG